MEFREAFGLLADLPSASLVRIAIFRQPCQTRRRYLYGRFSDNPRRPHRRTNFGRDLREFPFPFFAHLNSGRRREGQECPLFVASPSQPRRATRHVNSTRHLIECQDGMRCAARRDLHSRRPLFRSVFTPKLGSGASSVSPRGAILHGTLAHPTTTANQPLLDTKGAPTPSTMTATGEDTHTRDRWQKIVSHFQLGQSSQNPPGRGGEGRRGWCLSMLG